MSKKLKECTLSNLSYYEKPIFEARWTKYPRKLSGYKSTLLNAANSLLVWYKDVFLDSYFLLIFAQLNDKNNLTYFSH